MPLQLPQLDDVTFEQLLAEAKRRIPAHTPEWTTFGIESDPGITLVELMAFLADAITYRANRIPELNRLKFLKLLGVPLQPAAAADGLVVVRNERAPRTPLPLPPGIVVSAGAVDFLTLDGLNVLPIESAAYYKAKIDEDDPRQAELTASYKAVREAAALEATAAGADEGVSPLATELEFYEPRPLAAPTPADPAPALDLVSETLDRSLYVALLAPKNTPVEDARAAIAHQTLSVGMVPSLQGEPEPLLPRRTVSPERSGPRDLIFELPDTGKPVGNYQRLVPLLATNVLLKPGVVQVRLPGPTALATWTEFSDPLQEGTGDLPPPIEDEALRKQVITWLRIRVPAEVGPTNGDGVAAAAPAARLTWVGINAARVHQAIPVEGELLGTGNGEPDQVFRLSRTPVLVGTVRISVQDDEAGAEEWRRVEDLFAYGPTDKVFAVDGESGEVRSGDGFHGRRPGIGQRLIARYLYGGGRPGNVPIGAINRSPDPRLAAGFKIENPIPTSGGDTGETVTEAERRIPRYLAHRDRLVTARDFEDIARGTPGVDVARIEVLPLFEPGAVPEAPPTEPAAGVVTVLAIPSFDPIAPQWPVPDRLFLHRICEHLDRRRLITTKLYVRGPRYVDVYVSVGLKVRAGFFADEVRRAVSERLREYLSSIEPGGPDGEGWPLRKALVRKDLEAAVIRVAGIEYVESLEMGVGTPVDIPDYGLTGLELPKIVGLAVSEGAAEPLATAFGTKPMPSETKVVPVAVSRARC
jgi:hypothetical protein